MSKVSKIEVVANTMYWDDELIGKTLFETTDDDDLFQFNSSIRYVWPIIGQATGMYCFCDGELLFKCQQNDGVFLNLLCMVVQQSSVLLSN